MRAGKKVSSTDGGDRDVVDGRVARLEDSEGRVVSRMVSPAKTARMCPALVSRRGGRG